MIYNGLEFHNIAEVEETRRGLRMYRFPRAVCDSMGAVSENGENRFGRYVSQTTTGAEIRFVSEGDRVRIALTSLDFDGFVQVFWGDFLYYDGYEYQFPVRKDRVTVIELRRPDHLLKNLEPGALRDSFAPQVWRIMSGVNMTLAMVEFEGFGFPVRPPKREEVPEKTLLCYGTSLTYGACASAHGISYLQLLGRFLKCNILNKAMGGSCMNEPEVADYFVSGAEHFDGVFLENSVNMDGGALYRERTDYLLKQLTSTYPEMPIYCVTSYPNQFNISGNCAAPCRKGGTSKDGIELEEKDGITRELAKKYSCHLLEGVEIMDHATDMTFDGIHLSDYGHIRVAQNLSQRIVL